MIIGLLILRSKHMHKNNFLNSIFHLIEVIQKVSEGTICTAPPKPLSSSANHYYSSCDIESFSLSCLLLFFISKPLLLPNSQCCLCAVKDSIGRTLLVEYNENAKTLDHRDCREKSSKCTLTLTALQSPEDVFYTVIILTMAGDSLKVIIYC